MNGNPLNDAEYRTRLRTCARCEYGNKFGRCNGICPCAADPESRPFMDRAKSGECPLHRFGKPPLHEKRAVVQLGRFGDILNILPAIRRMAIDAGEPIPMVVGADYASLLDGLSYIRPVVYRGWEGDPVPAAELVASADRVIITQMWGNPVTLAFTAPGDPASYDQAAWVHAGMLDQWDTLPLVLDNRQHDRERQLVESVIGHETKPIVLFSSVGHSSPYPTGDAAALLEYLTAALPDARIIDLSGVRAERLQDFCGLYERASAILSTDSAPLHLSLVNRLPTVALVNDQAWRASFWHSHWLRRMSYAESKTANGRASIVEALEGILGQTTDGPAIFHVVDGFRPSNRGEYRRVLRAAETWPKDRWHTAYFRDYPRSSKQLGDTRTLPYVKDIFDWACARAGDDQIIVFTNSDTRLVPEAGAMIREAMKDQDRCFSRRVDVRDDGARNARDLDGQQTNDGIDVFAFRKSWWLATRKSYPDLLYACEGWDPALMLLMGPENEIDPVAFHVWHSAFWWQAENRTANVGQVHNRTLARSWAMASGFDEALTKEGSDYIFRTIKKKPDPKPVQTVPARKPGCNKCRRQSAAT